MSDNDDQNKTIMIRRSPAGEAETPPPAVKPAVKPEVKEAESSWLKSPLGIIGIVVAVVAVAFVLYKMMGK
jgi:hypothetical protein